jgi:hypothetical protein
MARGEGRERRPRPNVAVLSSTAYRILLSISYSVWGGMLIIVGYTHRFTLSVKRDDFLPLTSTTAALAAIALAILTYLHENANRDRYLKLALSGLTSLFLLTTTTGFLTALTFGSGEKTLHVRLVILGFVYLCMSSAFPIGVTLRKLSPFILSVVTRAEKTYDYSIFVAVAATFVVWSSDVSLTAVTVVAALGGMVLLVCSTAVMFVTLWHAKPHQEVLEDRIVETLKNAHRNQQQGNSTPQVISLSYLRNYLLSNDDTLLDAIENLQSEDRILEVEHQQFYCLQPGDWQMVENSVLACEAVVLGNRFDDECWNSIFRRLEAETRLPKQFLQQYFVERISDFVRANFEFRKKVSSGEYGHGAELELRTKFGAIDRIYTTLKAAVTPVMKKRKVYVTEYYDEIGLITLRLLNCLPTIERNDSYYKQLRYNVGGLILDDYKELLNASE